MSRLIPDSVAATIPALYAQENTSDAIAYVKLFTPDAAATWWIMEFSPKDKLMFGFCTLGDHELAELGFIDLEELEWLMGPIKMHVERDFYFKPVRLSEVTKSLGLRLAI